MTAWGSIAFFGAWGPVGTGGSELVGELVATGGLGAAPCALCTPAGEDENFEDIVDSHEFRRAGGEDKFFGRLPFPFCGIVLSDEPLLGKPGLCIGMGFADVGISVWWPLPFCVAFGSGGKESGKGWGLG